MRRKTPLEWTLILCCVVLAAVFGLIGAFDADGTFDATPCLAEMPSSSPDELSRALPVGGDAHRFLVASSAQLRLSAPDLLAAASGGLCLLI